MSVGGRSSAPSKGSMRPRSRNVGGEDDEDALAVEAFVSDICQKLYLFRARGDRVERKVVGL